MKMKKHSIHSNELLKAELHPRDSQFKKLLADTEISDQLEKISGRSRRSKFD